MAEDGRTPTARFESLAFQVERRRGRTARATAEDVIAAVFPRQSWSLAPLDERHGEFEVIPVSRTRSRGRPKPSRRLTPAAAWSAAYALRDHPRVIYAEPLFRVANDEQHRRVAPARGARSGLGDNDRGTAGNYEWNLEKLNVFQAWQLFGSRVPGSGIVVGHPDTGYTLHPEVTGPRLLIADGYDFEDGDPDARDTLPGGMLQHPGHGTSTSSLIMSDRGGAVSAGQPFVSGSAPGASLIPLRTTRSVVLWSMSQLTRAIRRAIELNVHVISISLGGPLPSVALQHVVRDAEAAGIIVLCAAGNQVGFVVFPAAFAEVIAVAASRIDDRPWAGSCRGPAVDITAPGSSVWRARTVRTGAREQYSVDRGSGTSYAVAATAGIAALWLSHHGRRELIARYGRERIAAVFKQLLQDTCRRPNGWDAAAFGPGIPDAAALLRAPLPEDAPARGLSGIRSRSVASDQSPIEILVHQLTPAPRSGVVSVVADLLNVGDRDLPAALDAVGAELIMIVGTNPSVRRRLRERAEAIHGSARGRSSRKVVRATVPLAKASGRLRGYLVSGSGLRSGVRKRTRRK